MRQSIFRKRQQGFTLIEIIAVLVVLAILAAVAVPRYMDTVAEARDASALQAVAEGQSRLSGISARLILAPGNGDIPTVPEVIAEWNADADNADAGDYGLTIAAGGGAPGDPDIDVTALGNPGSPAEGGTATRGWNLPTTAEAAAP